MKPSEQRAKNTDRNDPNTVSEESSESGESLQYPLNIDSEYEGFYVEFTAFDYERGLNENRTRVDKKKDRIRLPITAGIQSSYSAVYNDYENSYIFDGLRNLYNTVTSSSSLDMLSGMAQTIMGNPLDNKFTGDLTSKQIAYAKRNAKSLGGVYADQEAARTGKALNPRMETAFGGIGIREHSYEFVLIPTSSKEAEEIEKIVYKFKRYLHPAGGSRDSVFLSFPKEWNIGFYNSETGEHLKLPPIPDSFLVNVNVTYNQEGVSRFFADDHPFSVQLSLQFKEANMLLREDIENGGY